MNLVSIARPLAVAAIVAVLAGCGQSAKDGGNQSTTPAATKAGAPARVSVAFVTNNSSDYWTIARKGTEQAAADLKNVDVQFVMPDDGTAATQKTDVDQLLAKGVQGIAISPVDPANQTQLLNDAASKAVLFTQDSDAPKSARSCYVGTDNHAAGLLAGKLIKEAIPSGGKIMLFVGKRDAQNAKDREQGIRDAVAGSNIQIIDVRTDDADRAKAKSNVSDTLVKFPTVACLVGLWSYNGPAILSAVQDAHKVGAVKIVCFDEEDATLDGVKSGAIYATVVQQPYEIGYQAVKLLDQVIGGDKSVIPATKQVVIPVQAIKTADVDGFRTKLNKLRGRA